MFECLPIGTSLAKGLYISGITKHKKEGIFSGGVSQKFTGNKNCGDKIKDILLSSEAESFILHVGGNDAYTQSPGMVSADKILCQVRGFYQQVFQIVAERQKELFIVGYLPRYFAGHQESSGWKQLRTEDRKLKRLVRRWRLDHHQATAEYAKIAYLDIGFAFNEVSLFKPTDEVHLNEKGHLKYRQIISGRIVLNRNSGFKV